MNAAIPAHLKDLFDQLDAAERDARRLIDGLSEEKGTWQPPGGRWSVAECLDHLATANRVYLQAMRDAAEPARAAGSRRARPVQPGWGGRLFISSQEPPPKWWSKLKAPQKIRPRASPPLRNAFDAFIASQNEVREFMHSYAGIELSRVRFVNPFVRGIRFSLATGLHVITAHERRHLLQAWGVRTFVDG